ncbi:MAG: patatin-like phospholipase family protein [Candidatus Amoebophilus sp.]
MKQHYSVARQFMACVLFVSLCLQSCTSIDVPSNLPIKEGKKDVSERVARQLIGKQSITKEGHMVTFYQQGNQLRAEVGENLPQGFNKTHTLPVYIEEKMKLSQVASLNKEVEKKIVHVILPKNQERGYVYVGHTGLMGGGKNKKHRKQVLPGEEEAEEESEEKLPNSTETEGCQVAIQPAFSPGHQQESIPRLILSLDGGGIRGLLEAYTLNYIEKRLATKILDRFADPNAPAPTVRLGECFDLIAGTSTGGIIALAMRVIDPTTNRPRYDMETIAGIYKNKGDQIFYGNNSLWKLPCQAISNIYNPKPLEDILADYFGKATLKDLNSPTMVTSFDTKKRTIHFFSSHKAKNDRAHDFTLEDVARSTSAAPTYFPPANINNMCGKQYCFIDGGVAANNPVLYAYICAKDSLYQSDRFHVISLGTGIAEMPSLENKAKQGGIRLLPSLIGVLMDSNSKAVEPYIRSFINERKGDTYTRLDFEVDHQTVNALDDARANNLEKLVRSAEDTIQKEKDEILKSILDKLEEYYAQREYYVFHRLIKEVRSQLQHGNQKVNLSNAYLQKLAMPYVCERATWEIAHALSVPHMPRLTYLNLSGNELISKGNSLTYLEKLNSLIYLDLSNTNLTIDGLSKLKSAKLHLDILKVRNNPILNRIKAGRIANAIENYKISYLDSNVMRNLASHYQTQGRDTRAALMIDLADDKHTTGPAEFHLGRMYENGWDLAKNWEKAILWYQRAANQNHTEAQYRLGRIYENGRQAKKDEQMAAQWYEKAAIQGNRVAQNALCSMYERAVRQGCPKAQYNLGKMYYNGWGVDKNYQEAVEWFQKAANQGLAWAQYQLGYMYEYPKGLLQNYKEAAKWYQAAAKQGITTAQVKLAGMSYYGLGVDKDEQEAFRWFQKAANQGHAAAQLGLGVMYVNGRGVTKDDVKAVEWIEKAVNQGDAEAQLVLGIMYANGRGVNKDEEQAVAWYQKAADKGSAVAQYMLEQRYENGRGVTKDDVKAVEWYKKAAKQVHTSAQYSLEVRYENGQGVAQDDGKAVEWYKKAAKQGDAEAQYILGCMYDDGRGVIKDEQKAFKWYQKAAAQGYVGAQYNLGVIYEGGMGIKQNYKQAVSWYQAATEKGSPIAQASLARMYFNGRGIKKDIKRAGALLQLVHKEIQAGAERGDIECQFMLGWMYYNGQGVDKDDAEAVEWYEKAASQGYVGAQNNLGIMYNNGRGVEKDDAKAVEWYKKAAEKGYAYAQFNLGLMYEYRQGVAKDDAKAVEWYKKAAEKGYAYAQFNLGRMYENGQGVAKDYAKAKDWYRKAARRGDAKAKVALSKLESFN